MVGKGGQHQPKELMSCAGGITAGPYKDTVNLPQTKFNMRANSTQREPEIQRRWTESGVYEHLLENNPGPVFTLHDGPPYANGCALFLALKFWWGCLCVCVLRGGACTRMCMLFPCIVLLVCVCVCAHGCVHACVSMCVCACARTCTCMPTHVHSCVCDARPERRRGWLSVPS